MIVECRPYRPTEVGKQTEVDGGQYRIYVDEKPVGFIGYHDGAVPMIVYRRSPRELEEIERQVREQLAPQKVGTIRQVSADPPKPFEAPKTYDDFD